MKKHRGKGDSGVSAHIYEAPRINLMEYVCEDSVKIGAEMRKILYYFELFGTDCDPPKFYSGRGQRNV